VRERATELERRRVQLANTLAAAIGAPATGAAGDLPTRIGDAAERETLLTALHDTFTQWRTAAAEHASRSRHLDTALRSAGFAVLAEVRAVRLGSGEISDLEALLQARSAERQQVDSVLRDPAVLAAAESEPVDVHALEQRLADVEQTRDAVLAEQNELARQADRLEQLHSDLDAALAAWRPVRAEHDTVSGLAALCAGTSSDNPDRVRLSSYVLAARLAQVVDAANERLTSMTAGRYVLERTDARGVGDRRGGLGLRVCDGWTGESRDPATLSGGESFVASLALALGLADVVAYEAGGVELGTLFVDEGFGSLDADTLDEVLDVLDDLRSGGRVVGLVSHMPELRARVGAQIRVAKSRGGSTLVQV
jgi:DNA repair protein SbcC/Rad50